MSVDFQYVDVYVIHDHPHHHHHHHHHHIIVPYEDQSMLLSDSLYLLQGVEDLLIPYEDMLML